MTVISILVILFYAIFVYYCSKGWKKLIVLNTSNELNLKFSIVIALRNEADNILALLEDLNNQNYPFQNFELILVDDHSEDRSLEIISNYQKHATINLRVFSLLNEKGKKAAIEEGIHQAVHEFIVVTDADCRIGKDWLGLYATYFQKLQAQFLAAPVALQGDHSLFSEMQKLEFQILSGTTASFFGLRDAIMCNAANMAFRKSFFIAAKAHLRKEIASGDDVFLLHSAKALFPKQIYFILDQRTVVRSSVKKTLESFLQQRLRWAGKSIYYRDSISLSVASVVFFINAVLLTLFFLAFSSLYFASLLFSVFLLKFLLDLYLAKQFQLFFQSRGLLLKSFLLSLLYPFYVVGIAFFSIFVKARWKGRKI